MTAIATRARLTVVAVIAGLMMIIGAAAPAMADTNDDIIAVHDELAAAGDTFFADQSTEFEGAIAAVEAFKTAAETAQGKYDSIAKSSSDTGAAAFAKEFAGETGEMASAADALIAAFKAQDQGAAQKSQNDLNAAFESYDKSADKYNEYLKTAGSPDYIVWLIVLIIAIVFLVLALVFALLTRKQEGLLDPKVDKKGKVTQGSLKKLRWMVVLWAAVFVVGAAIPFVQILFAKPGDTYRIFFYPLILGVILSIVGVIQYFVAASKVKKQGSAAAYDANDPSTHGALAQSLNYQPVPPVDGAAPQYAPVAPQADAAVQGAPVPPAAPVAEAPVAPEAPSAPAEAAPAAPEAPADPAAPKA